MVLVLIFSGICFKVTVNQVIPLVVSSLCVFLSSEEHKI